MSNHVNLRKCLTDKGLDFEYYIGVARHVVDTLENDELVQEDRYVEDIKHLADLFKMCGESTISKKWEKIVTILQQRR